MHAWSAAAQDCTRGRAQNNLVQVVVQCFASSMCVQFKSNQQRLQNEGENSGSIFSVPRFLPQDLRPGKVIIKPL